MNATTTDSQRVALVTGASRGIGRAVALALAEQNIHILLLARTQGGLEEVYDEIVNAGGEATGVPMDLTDYEAIDRLGGVIAERWRKLDIFVGNAGILGPISPVAHMKPDEFEKTLAVNVTANARLIRALEPLLLASDNGRAVFLTSGAAYSTKPFWGAYSTSKAALDALVKSWANEQKNTSLKNKSLFARPGQNGNARSGHARRKPFNLADCRRYCTTNCITLFTGLSGDW